VLCAIPEIAEAVVVGIPDPTWGEIVTAVVVWRESMELDFPTLRAGCQAKLPNYKCPRRVLAMDRLPRTASGKSARAAIKDMVLRGASVLTVVR
jgi:acyl-coenzyme A synthetase/AMP-(fatty) acid ligase